MDPHGLFALSGPVAMAGWIALLATPLAPRLTDAVATLVVPGLLALAYTGLVLAFFADAPGGFGSLADVMALMTNPHVALAGWLHWLAFDLFVGAWIVRTGRRAGMPHWLLVPVLPVTLMFGPAGLLLFLALRTAHAAVAAGRSSSGVVA